MKINIQQFINQFALLERTEKTVKVKILEENFNNIFKTMKDLEKNINELQETNNKLETHNKSLFSRNQTLQKQSLSQVDDMKELKTICKMLLNENIEYLREKERFRATHRINQLDTLSTKWSLK